MFICASVSVCVRARVRMPQHFPMCHSLSICGSVYEFMCALEFVGMLVGDRGTCLSE